MTRDPILPPTPRELTQHRPPSDPELLVGMFHAGGFVVGAVVALVLFAGCGGPAVHANRVPPGELPLPIPPPPRPQIPCEPSSRAVLEWDASDPVFRYIDDGEQVYLSVSDCEAFGLEPPVRIVPRKIPFDDHVDLDAYAKALHSRHDSRKPTFLAKELWRRGFWVDGIFPPPDFNEQEDRPNRYSDCYLTRPLPGEIQQKHRLPRNWRPAAEQARKAAARARGASEHAMAEEARL